MKRFSCWQAPLFTTAIFSLTLLLAAYHVSTSATSNVGFGFPAIAQAYARPPPYVSRSTRSTSSSNKIDERCISCFDGNQPFSAVCKLRCGGGINDGNFQSRHSSPLTMMTRTSTDTDSSSTAMAKKSAKYHLVWSQNFWKKMAISTVLWSIVQYYGLLSTKSVSLETILFPGIDCHTSGQPSTTAAIGGIRRIFSSSIVLPLLSSSCCAIQLIINALSGWGCAGFNTYLGPIRPILLPLFLLSTWKLFPHRSISWTIVSIFLAFLPELVGVKNIVRSKQWQRKHDGDIIGNQDAEDEATLSSLPITAKLQLNIPTMGCVACVNKVDSSIRQCKSSSNIREETSWLTEGDAKGGMAELLISASTDEELDKIVKEVTDAVNNAGFKCDVESLQVQ